MSDESVGSMWNKWWDESERIPGAEAQFGVRFKVRAKARTYLRSKNKGKPIRQTLPKTFWGYVRKVPRSDSSEPTYAVAGMEVGVDWGFLRRMAAEIRVMKRPTGKGSMKV